MHPRKSFNRITFSARYPEKKALLDGEIDRASEWEETVFVCDGSGGYIHLTIFDGWLIEDAYGPIQCTGTEADLSAKALRWLTRRGMEVAGEGRFEEAYNLAPRKRVR